MEADDLILPDQEGCESYPLRPMRLIDNNFGLWVYHCKQCGRRHSVHREYASVLHRCPVIDIEGEVTE